MALLVFAVNKGLCAIPNQQTYWLFFVTDAMVVHHDFTVRFIKSILYELGALIFVMMQGKEALNVLILMPLGVICLCKHGEE